MPDRLYFTESDEANALIAADPMALLVGFELDQRKQQRAALGEVEVQGLPGDAGGARDRRHGRHGVRRGLDQAVRVVEDSLTRT